MMKSYHTFAVVLLVAAGLLCSACSDVKDDIQTELGDDLAGPKAFSGFWVWQVPSYAGTTSSHEQAFRYNSQEYTLRFSREEGNLSMALYDFPFTDMAMSVLGQEMDEVVTMPTNDFPVLFNLISSLGDRPCIILGSKIDLQEVGYSSAYMYYKMKSRGSNDPMLYVVYCAHAKDYGWKALVLKISREESEVLLNPQSNSVSLSFHITSVDVVSMEGETERSIPYNIDLNFYSNNRN